MELSVEIREHNGNINLKQFDINILTLIKHIGLVGNKNAEHLLINFKAIGFFQYFYRYLNSIFPIYHLHRPNDFFHDPTEMAQFSNIIGKGIADFLARRISGAKYTHTYEAVLTLKRIIYSGERPDLYCDTGKEQFSLEAKGFSVRSVSLNKMSKIKKQANSGPVPINFSIASVTYNIFDYPLKCKYYDPDNDYKEYDKENNIILSKLYYANIINLFNDLSHSKEISILDHKYLSFKFSINGLTPINFLLNQKILTFLEKETERPNFESFELAVILGFNSLHLPW